MKNLKKLNGNEDKKYIRVDGLNIKDSLKKISRINKKSLKNGSYSMIYTVLLIAIVVVINLIVGEIPEKYTQIDVSSQKLYTIGEETEEFLKNLDQDVDIYYIVQNGLEDSVVDKMLTRYEEESDHIRVEKKDPVLYPNFTSQYTEDSVSDNSLIVVCNEKSRVVNYSSLYDVEYDYYTGSSNMTGFDGEGQIDSAISYVTSEELPKIYMLEGHGELELDSNFTEALKKANYETESLNLMTSDEVPEDAGCLMILSPKNDFSDEERDKVLQYLENGGKMILIVDYSTNELSNVQTVLQNYGLEIKKGVVMEQDPNHYIMQTPYYLVPNIESSEITSDLRANNRYVLVPIAEAIGVQDSYRDTLEIKTLLSTSEDAYLKEDVENMQTFEKEDGDEQGSFNLGVSVTEAAGNDQETQIVCYSSSSILDSTVNQQIAGGNEELLMNTLGWMCEVEAPVISVNSKSLTMNYLVIPEYDSSYWSAVTCGIIPIAFLLIGGIIWFKRRKQ